MPAFQESPTGSVHSTARPGNQGAVTLLTLLLSGLAATPAAEAPTLAPSPTPAARATEGVRAIWVTRWDFRSAEDVRRILHNCASLGLDRVYFQVRGRADAFYRSSLEPWAEELGGRDPGFDPLAVAIGEARRLGVELHAWINVLAGWKGREAPRDRRHIWHTHPEWFLLDKSGKRHRLHEHYTMLNPCSAAVRRHLTLVAQDIVRRYPVDGLHLDYIRFVFPEGVRRSEVPWDPATLAAFRAFSGGNPDAHAAKWNSFRERAVNSVVWEITQAVRASRPELCISAAVVRDLDRGRELYMQRSQAWLEQGWIDEVLPMNYQRDTRAFRESARLDLARAGGRSITGLGAHLYASGSELRSQLEANASIGARGYALFAYTSFFPTPSHASRSGPEAQRLRHQLRAALRAFNSTHPGIARRELPVRRPIPIQSAGPERTSSKARRR